jgi:hypothetical protein
MKRRLTLGVLFLALTACQPAAPAPPAAPLPPPPRAAVWGEVPRQICTCHEDALSRVESVLQESQLAVDFKIESGTEGWHIFSVTFDPTHVAPTQVTQILEGAGALIIPARVGH